jgi:diguanylate cyclase (GGDEF)-like protein/PAS domain S-box-containing protein
LIAAALGAIARYDVGGPFVWGGVVGFLFYFAAGVTAWLWLRHKDRRHIGPLGLITLGIGATIAVLPSFFVSADFATGLKILASFGWVLACGNVLGVIALGTVIERANQVLDTNEKLLASAEASNNKMKLVLNAIPGMVGYWDMERRNVFANKEYSRWFGIPQEDIQGRTIEEVLANKGHDVISTHVLAVLNGQEQKFQRTMEDTNGRERIFEISYLPQTQDGEVVGFHSVVFDITDAEIARREVEHAAHHDLLTGLGNRTKLTLALPTMIEDAQADACDIAFMILDLDRFKQVNDTLGHSAGDELLNQVANRLNDCVRDTDLVVRLGGDEFAICIKGKNGLQLEVSTLAERIIRDVSKPYDIHGREVVIGISVGIAIGNAQDSHIESLMRDADVALYYVKGNGRNNYRIFEAGDADTKTCIGSMQRSLLTA